MSRQTEKKVEIFFGSQVYKSLKKGETFRRPSRYKDLSGKTFGRLTAMWPEGRDKHRQVYWLWLCVCGKLAHIKGRSVTSGATKSCGCLHDELSAIRCVELRTRHGMSCSAEYRSYSAAKRRCTNSSSHPSKNFLRKWVKNPVADILSIASITMDIMNRVMFVGQLAASKCLIAET